jgi:hypothetical protein
MRAKCPKDGKGCYQHISQTGFPYRCRYHKKLYGYFGECAEMIKYLREKLTEVGK